MTYFKKYMKSRIQKRSIVKKFSISMTISVRNKKNFEIVANCKIFVK